MIAKSLHFALIEHLDEQPEDVNSTSVQFIYRKLLFSEIKWPSVQVQRLTRVRWASDHDEFVSVKFDELRFERVELYIVTIEFNSIVSK